MIYQKNEKFLLFRRKRNYNPIREITLLCFLFCFTIKASSQDSQAINKGLDAINLETVRGQLNFLASDWTEGRYTGEKGEYIAGDYISSVFGLLGLKPLGDSISTNKRSKTQTELKYRSFFQKYPLMEVTPNENQELNFVSVKNNSTVIQKFKYKTDFTTTSNTLGVEIDAPVTFVGYGITDENTGYDDFRKINVKGHVVLCLSNYPGYNDTTSKAFKKFKPIVKKGKKSFNKMKMRSLKKSGAVAILEIDTQTEIENSLVENVPFRYNDFSYEGKKNPYEKIYGKSLHLLSDTSEFSIPVFKISKRIANELLKETGTNLKDFEAYAKSTMKSQSQVLKDSRIQVKTTADTRIIQTRNVIGVIEGEKTDEVIVIGGHYDHLGKFENIIFNGADDNASGTVGVMTLAKAVLATGIKPKRTIVFAAWTGEERGLLGSKYFVQNPVFPLKNFVFHMNFDMISSSASTDTLKNKGMLGYTEEYPIIKSITQKNISKYNIDLDLEYKAQLNSSAGRSDHASFARKDIPFMVINTGVHDDYHRRTDQVNKTDWDKFLRVMKLQFLNLWEIANLEEIPKVS